MSDEFTQAAVSIAVADLEETLIQAGRTYEDAQRAGDAQTAAFALNNYTEAQIKYDRLTGANQPKQQAGQLTNAQRNFLSRRQAMGDDLSPQRMKDYDAAHHRALAAGWAVDSPQYFAAVAGHVDHAGDGREAPLNERSAAELCGIDEQTYAQNAQKLRMLKQRGHYQD
jgi:hypothetical protein